MQVPTNRGRPRAVGTRHMRTPCLALLLLAPFATAQNEQWNAVTIRPGTLGHEVPELRGKTLPALAAHVEAHRNEDRTARELAWLSLACSGLGSNLRHGGLKAPLKDVIRRLRDRQRSHDTLADQDGDDALRNKDHLLATVALAVAWRDASFKLIQKYASQATERVLNDYEAAEQIADDEVALLAVLGNALDTTTFAALAKRVRALAERHAEKLPKERSRRAEAACHLVDKLGGEPFVAELTIAKCWPGDLAKDPMHTWIAAFASRDLSFEQKQALWPRMERLIAQRGDDGLWPAADGFDRITTTATLAAALGMVHPTPPKAPQADDPGAAFR